MVTFALTKKLELRKKLVTRSERVKTTEFHEELPWLLVGLYSGNISIYDYE